MYANCGIEKYVENPRMIMYWMFCCRKWVIYFIGGFFDSGMSCECCFLVVSDLVEIIFNYICLSIAIFL